jgi:tungstate transport system ATP-binding protein
MIELVNVSKNYGAVHALRDACLNVVKGEVLTIIGPNGSGKTTLLKIIAGLERPSSGEVFFEGAKVYISNVASIRLKTTMVFQKTIVFKGSVSDNVAYGLKCRNIGLADERMRVNEALNLVGLKHLEDRNAQELSGGEQQRLSLARAIILNCELLLLDEPTANLDPDSLIIVKDVIKRLNRERGATIIIATHNLESAEALSTKIVLMDDGRIVDEVGPDELFNSSSPELARFTRSENVFFGDSRVIEGVTQVSIGGGVEVAVAVKHEGRALVHVRPEDIIISLDKMDSSARNNLKGRIVSIVDMDSIVKLKIDTGSIFTAQITHRSLLEMGLNVGQEIYLTFKASSVNIQ